MGDEVSAFFIGMAAGSLVALLLFFLFPNENTRLLAECEKDLPRSQKCVLIAVENDNE